MPLNIGSRIPSFEGATDWLSGESAVAQIEGRPFIVQFWSVSCPICKTNMPGLQQIIADYAAHGLYLISVHMPRMEADTDIRKIKEAIAEMGLSGPCVVDNNHIIGDRFQTAGLWPYYFLFDAEGRLRSRAAGVLGIKMAENSLKRMLGKCQETSGRGAAVP